MSSTIPFNESIAEGFIKSKGGAGGLHDFLGIRITSAEPGIMTGQLDVRKELLTPFGNMHGGVLSAFCDHMLGCVCYPAMKKGQWAATTEFKINLTAPVSKGVVEARAEIINLSRTQAVVRIDITNEGRTAAVAQGTVTIRDPK
ncbi:MAG: PaaI family thioesterase [Gammaproteobacteria bacterium]|jgi:1,4-dihydroxy-2-naphthoyl-CoA hydrolase|nr:PaaI family thioesterase [Kordiimonadaceae bacterium]